MEAPDNVFRSRALNFIYETTEERGATMLIPPAMVDSMNPAGVLDLTAVAGSLPSKA